VINLGIEVFSISIPYGVAGGFLALIISMIVFIVVSLITPVVELQPDIKAAMEI
jgi:sodium/proline symporter/sodium/pantothenate symporter